MDVDQLAVSLFGKLKEFVGHRLAGIDQRLAAVEARPAPERGEKGDPGLEGKAGVPGDRGEPGLPGERGEPGAPGEKGDPGQAGQTGTKGDPGETGAKGDPGEKGDLGEKGDRGDAGDPGLHGDAGAKGDPGERGEPGQKGDPGLNGKDGEPGSDGNVAAMHVLGILETDKRYDRGTFIAHAGGLIFATRATDPVKDGDRLDAAGWLVVLNGIAEPEDEVVENDGRTVTRTTRYTDGRSRTVVEKRDIVLDRGVWRDTSVYAKGDHVSSGGSGWIAQRSDNLGRPGLDDSGWRLSTKAGRDGKHGEKGDKGDPGRARP